MVASLNKISIRGLVICLVLLAGCDLGKNLETQPATTLQPKEDVRSNPGNETYIERYIQIYLLSLKRIHQQKLLSPERVQYYLPHDGIEALLEEGQLALHKKLVRKINVSPEAQDYNDALGRAVILSGFDSLEQWAAFADFVTNATYAASDDGKCARMDQQMAEITQLHGGIPRELALAFERAFLLCGIASKVPSLEAEALAPWLDEISALNKPLMGSNSSDT